MEIIESDYTLKLSRREMLAIQKALYELRCLQAKCPEEKNGFDLTSQGITNGFRDKLNAILG